MSDFDYSIYNKNKDRAQGFKKSTHRAPMSREQRAKQFAPFDALTGLHARLAKAIEEHKEDCDAETLVHVDLDE